MEGWLQLAGDVLPDAIKILGSAIVTGTFTYLAMRSQVRAAIDTAKERNQFEARSKIFEHYNAQAEAAENKAEEATRRLGEMMGTSVAEEMDGKHGRLITKYLDPVFEQSVRQQPYVLRRVRKSVVQHVGEDTPELELIKSVENRLEELKPVSDHKTLVDATHLLIDSYSVTSMCYSLIYEQQASKVLEEYVESR